MVVFFKFDLNTVLNIYVFILFREPVQTVHVYLKNSNVMMLQIALTNLMKIMICVERIEQNLKLFYRIAEKKMNK